MKWGAQQNTALSRVDEWLASGHSPIFRLFGYAGTGKTTLAKHLAEGVSGRVKFAAYTGKAAQVLSEKGCPATTIHKLIYVPKSKSKTRLNGLQQQLVDMVRDLSQTLTQAQIDQRSDVLKCRAQIKEEEENLRGMMFQKNLESELYGCSLLVVDECSMVDMQVGQDLLSFDVPILVLGDPAQLPPVMGGGFFTEAKPDMMLTDIHRQAKDNPIIEMATRVREDRGLPLGSYGDSAVHRFGTPMEDIARRADQLICGRNKTRRAANKRIRQFKGFEGDLPVVGDRLVCLSNDHEEGLLNGQIWIAAADAQDAGETYLLTAYPEDNEANVKEMTVWATEPDWHERREAQSFDFGYCLTCHKSQGSQWDHVMVMDESRSFKKDANRWLYTAITRAAERVDVVGM
ncbi:exonuclease V [Alphaproteobacteria phage PhiJL001]|uniref:Exonuclease V n=1 Tax=Alphaproteobacteria phage PhiJL001 TaxID=2681607 RepID=Q5DN92_9CAUD|nr:Dda-like helicase [Alphaproteobacteria phage PhiJL001]AAT69489.1 exonuclease V [Alphaproteobacteria phage PhiJL001]